MGLGECQEIVLLALKLLEAHHSSSHYTRMRDQTLMNLFLPLFEGNNELSLESPVVKGIHTADMLSKESTNTLDSPGWFLYSEELLGSSVHPGGFVLG